VNKKSKEEVLSRCLGPKELLRANNVSAMPREIEALPRNDPVELVDPLGVNARSASAIADRLERLETGLAKLFDALDVVRGLVAAKMVVKEWYSTNEVAQILTRRPYTVREWCRLGRINATRTHAGRGEVEEWRISHQELQRIQNEGLLPLKPR
jgi:hypothetical protein